MKWPQILTVLLGVVAVALAVRSRNARTESTAAPAPVAASAVDIGRPLPPSFDRPGVVSRQIGLLRVSVAAAPEIPLETPADRTTRRTEAAPILVALENETYQPLTGAALGWQGTQLCTVRVARQTDDAREIEVFQNEVPLPVRTDWLSAERRNFSVDWPVRDVTPGTYKISVQLALPEQPTLELLTRVL